MKQAETALTTEKKGTGSFCAQHPKGLPGKRCLSPFSFPTDDPRLPLGVVPPEAEPFSLQRLAQLTWCLVFLGLAARLIRYLLGFPLWQDEAYLCVNLLDRSYADLLAPLTNHQVAPILFLWIQATVVRVLGFSEYTLRLFPLICSVAGLFRHVAARLLRGTALLLAVGIFAVGYPLVRYACEAKPYGCDMFASLVLVALAVQWYVSENQRWLWALVACVPLALGLSYPAVFTAAGVSLAVAYGLWSTSKSRAGEGTGQGSTSLSAAKGVVGGVSTPFVPQSVPLGGLLGTWTAWLCYNLALAASFAGIYWLSINPQSTAELAWMRDYWKDIFPPLGSAWGMLKWLVVAHTSELLQYPIGGARGASTLTTVCCIAAVIFLWRRRQRWLVVLCLAPLVPNLAAALAWRYPYGGSVRFVLYLAPAVCLLAGLGAAALVVRRDRQGVVRGRTAVLVVFGLLAAVAVGSIGRDFARPYRTRDVRAQRDFARWFWSNQEYDGEVACWERDVAEGAGSRVAERPMAALYFCNRRIYSPRAHRGAPVEWAHVSAERPLRMVRYGASNVDRDEGSFDRWLAAARSRYALVEQKRYTLPMHYKDRDLLYYDYLDLYEFVPRYDRTAGREMPLQE